MLPIMVHMESQNRNAVLALAAAGVLWGLTVPLSKLALGWLGPAWLTVARFAVAAPLLALLGRRGLRAALRPGIAAAGALGFGAVIVLQNAGIARTSVSHAAVLVGAVPVLVALIAVALRQSPAGLRPWAGYGLALAGIAGVAGSSGGGATVLGDVLVFASAALSAVFIVVQPGLLAGRDAAAVTAVQGLAGGLFALPVALLTEPLPGVPAGPGLAVATVSLAIAGTLLPFWLFAFGQARVSAQMAGAFVNLEPVVGAAIGWIGFGDAAAPAQLAGAVAVVAGIVLSTRRESTGPGVAVTEPAVAVPVDAAPPAARPARHRPLLRGRAAPEPSRRSRPRRRRGGSAAGRAAGRLAAARTRARSG